VLLDFCSLPCFFSFQHPPEPGPFLVSACDLLSPVRVGLSLFLFFWAWPCIGVLLECLPSLPPVVLFLLFPHRCSVGAWLLLAVPHRIFEEKILQSLCNGFPGCKWKGLLIDRKSWRAVLLESRLLFFLTNLTRVLSVLLPFRVRS